MRQMLERGTGGRGSDLFEIMATLATVRRFLPDPVDDSTLYSVIEAATRAASARNTQPWYFVAVRSPDTRRQIARLYLQAWQQAKAYTKSVDADADIKDRPGYGAMMEQVDELARNLERVPVLLLACLDPAQLGPLADAQGRILAPQSAYASIFPAVQNLMLAAHALGLGTALTTLIHGVENEIRDAVGIPPPIHVAALLPLGYPARRFRPARRKPVEQVAYLDRWGEPLRDGPSGPPQGRPRD